MKETENILESAGATWAYLHEYSRLQVDQAKLEFADRTSRVVSMIILLIASVFLAGMTITFALFAAAWWMGNVLNSPPLGFLTITLGLMLIGSVLYIFRKKLITIPVVNLILRELLDDN